MAETDTRRFVVPAPPAGGRSTPPPRRTPEVVLPSSAPTDPAGGHTMVAAAPPAAPTPSPRTDRPARVVIPAPGAAPKPAPAPPAAVKPAAKAPAARHRDPARTDRRWPPSRRTVVRTVLGIFLVLALLAVGGLLYGYQQFRSIERVELADVLASADGTNYLIVGSDTRAGISPDDPNAGAILGPDAQGGEPERSDTIMILRVDGEGSRMLSVPRDLLVTISETGQTTRINAAFNGGPHRLIATLRDQLQLPIHHYLEIDFVAFRDLVDALGGITIDFPHPASDHMSGLNVPEAGPQVLDGTQALAYVRSRYYTETIDGRQVTEPTGDIGRTVRQQQFLSAVVSEMSGERNPLRLARMTSSMAAGMRIDDQMSYLDAVRLALRMRGMELEPTALPTSNRTLGSGAQVLDLVQPGADEILARFGSPGATIG
ncbi:LCP family protein [Acidimicrobiia bacterium EGI L10123]|uniref:LCP family protein n=1 Tax=Salinilacustrithrix flava TaxID=2957203 RepID=UPI003D7C1621|nr:LCP family protein [Acidimicrobiia bacterium EGI L10123]